MKITFIGAGSTVFVRNTMGDCILTPEFGKFEIALYDIDPERLADSETILTAIAKKYNDKVTVKGYADPVKALDGADYVINAIQVGGYEPATVRDFEIPKKYGLRQTIADTMGIGGIFRALRTIPALEKYTKIMEKVCPNALFLNYTNPMAMVTGYFQQTSPIRTVGLCHSVQAMLPSLADWYDFPALKEEGVSFKAAGINHMCWLLEVKDKKGNDLYPAMKKQMNAHPAKNDLVRLDMMNRFGYYNSESSEHTAEYHAFYIKNRYPELIEKYNIPLDEYPRRCIAQINEWHKCRENLIKESKIEHKLSREYCMRILKAHYTDTPYKIYGNVINDGVIENLPRNACVEVPVVVDGCGFTKCYVGSLPEQLAALNRSNIGCQLMTIQAAKSHKKEDLYMAAYLDPHAAAELSMDDIRSLCDDLLEAHKDLMPEYK